jgi:hypothetical protein
MAEVSNWMHVDHFSVDQASALWCGYDPANFESSFSRIPSEVLATKQLLIGGIVSGTLPADSTHNYMHSIGDFSKSLLARTNLEKFARAKNLFPAFLFDTLSPFQRDSRSYMNPFITLPTPLPQAAKQESVPVSSRGGRPTEYDWDSFTLEIIRRANNLDGLPDSQAELIRDMQQWFANTFDTEPAESSIKSRISKIYRYLTDAKAKGKNPNV